MSAVSTRRLFDPNRKTQLTWVSSDKTDIKTTWERWRAEHAKPVDSESYQRDVLAEMRARKVKR